MASDIAVFDMTTGEGVLFNQNEDNAILTGPKRMAQTFVVRLSTAKGSMTYLQNEGCILADRILKGYVATEHDVYQLFALSMLDIAPKMLADETTDTPDDEKFVSAELSNVVISPGQVALGISITNGSGNQLGVMVPFTFNF